MSRIVRLPGGEYVEVLRALDEEERARIALPDAPIPPDLGPDALGRRPLTRRLRARLWDLYTSGRLDEGESPLNPDAKPVTDAAPESMPLSRQ